MRVVSLNLDAADAEALRRLIEQRIAGCRCAQRPPESPCAECASLLGTASELDRLLRRPRLGLPGLGLARSRTGQALPLGPTLADGVRGRGNLRLVRRAAEA